MDVFATWWAWVAAGIVLGILEILVPGYIFLGFAVGAVAVGGILATGLIAPGVPWTLVIFAGLSLVAYLILVRRFRSGRGQVKVIDRDINENPPPRR